MSQTRVQLNVRLPRPLREKVQADSDRGGRIITRDVVVAAVLHDFFSTLKTTARENVYRKYLAELKKRAPLPQPASSPAEGPAVNTENPVQPA